MRSPGSTPGQGTLTFLALKNWKLRYLDVRGFDVSEEGVQIFIREKENYEIITDFTKMTKHFLISD